MRKYKKFISHVLLALAIILLAIIVIFTIITIFDMTIVKIYTGQ
ncbi:hypothetical protein [Thermoanaerobacterium sp. RBIITD]|nr:hypothetical protein [Thermoanaerobacterium sp. RBIITD]SNX53250.1 hypothetical protein SAMN05660242_0761 [Thermoanaerobacterium sp. RBIITD]